MSWEHVNHPYPAKHCSVEGCERKHQARSMCKYHWQNWSRHGTPTPFNFRLPNPIKIDGDVARMTIFRGVTNKPIAETIFDAEDAPLVRRYKWCLTDGYIKNNQWPLAGFIMGRQKWVDHINGDRLDNRKSNLRPVDREQNSRNVSVQNRKKSSKYKGVWKTETVSKPWRANIKMRGQNFYIGRFKTEEEAAWMYDQYALELFGVYARTNLHYQ